MFDFQDLIPYLFSIGLIFTVSYAYMAHLHCGIAECWIEGKTVRQAAPLQPIAIIIGHVTPIRLARMIRRKEAPDEDAGDCFPSLIRTLDYQRGGTKWDHSRDLLLQEKRYVYTV